MNDEDDYILKYETNDNPSKAGSDGGFGKISPDEFKNFIGETIRLDPIMMDKNTSAEQLLPFYRRKNTPDRQLFIINNLKVELDAM